MCQRDSDAPLLSMRLIIDINSDKPGQWRGIDANSGEVPASFCNIDLTTTPSLTSTLYTVSDVANSNECGFDVVSAHFVQSMSEMTKPAKS